MLLIVGAVLLVLMHFYGILSWDINLKKLIFVTAVAVVLCISYFILVNFSSKLSLFDFQCVGYCLACESALLTWSVYAVKFTVSIVLIKFDFGLLLI